MAKAMVGSSPAELRTFTDCMYFINGYCKMNDKCRYRHCPTAAAQTNNCFKWPKVCRNVKCPYRHPAPPKLAEKNKSLTAIPVPPAKPQEETLISFFWDIENVPIPKGQKPFDIVQRIRQKLVIDGGLREYSFSCYCNSPTIPQENQLSLFHANVRIVHVPDRKPGAVDRQIMLELDRFERAHRPPATIVLISGDIDFVGKLGDLRHQAGFCVIVIHNKPAKQELKATVNAHYPWEAFTAPVDAMPNLMEEAKPRIPQPYRMSTQNKSGNLRRVDPSPKRTSPIKTLMHPCPKCSSQFETIPSLRQHQEAKDHLFECPECDETFVTSDGLVQHIKAKDHDEIYKCAQCQRRFNTLDSLNQHKRSVGHDGFVLIADPVPFRPIPPPVTPTRNTQTAGDAMQDAAMTIISQGIAALVRHYPAVLRKN